MSPAKREEVREGDAVTACKPSLGERVLRAFPWLVAACAIGGAAALLAWIPASVERGEGPPPAQGVQAVAVAEVQVEVEPEAAGKSPSPPRRNPHSPYAHLQDQVVPRDMRTFHEGGPVGLLGLGNRPSETQLCDDSNWSRMEIVEEVDGQQVFVDQSAWKNAPVGTRAQLANWMSRCKRQGDGVEIYGDGNGALLATYHPNQGLVLLD
jgi:hypothetical protein